MKTIIIAGYLAGIVYQLLFMGLIQYFANANREAFEEVMEKYGNGSLSTNMMYLISSVIMFIAMIVAAMVWPIGLLWNLWIRIKVKYLFWKTMKKLKKLEKELKEFLGEDL